MVTLTQGMSLPSSKKPVFQYVLVAALIAMIMFSMACAGFAFGIYSSGREIEAMRRAAQQEKKMIAAAKFEPPSDTQCVKYLFNDQNLASVKRRVCGRGF